MLPNTKIIISKNGSSRVMYEGIMEDDFNEFPYYKVGKHLKFRLSEINNWLKKYRSSGVKNY